MSPVHKQERSDSPINVLNIPKPSLQPDETFNQHTVDLAVVPQIAVSKPASRVKTEPLDLDEIIEEVAQAIATTEDHYKCIMFTDLEKFNRIQAFHGSYQGIYAKPVIL